jgi:hypothetical protein
MEEQMADWPFFPNHLGGITPKMIFILGNSLFYIDNNCNWSYNIDVHSI